MSTSCNDTNFAKIGTPEQDEAKDVHMVKAKILSIDRTLRTAEIQYITSCAGITQTTAVEFFYYCPYSDGGEDILINGHWAFLPDDFVYVTKLGIKTYIVGHADIRDTKPCAAEWYLLRLGSLYNCSPFYIFDIYTGKLYDKWPGITWPIYPARNWDEPGSNGYYKVQEYRDWRMLYRNKVTPVHSGSAWDRIRWSSDLGRYEEYTEADEWDLYIHNQFRVGFSWKPGALQSKFVAWGSGYGPTEDSNGSSGPIETPCQGDNRCTRSTWTGSTWKIEGLTSPNLYDYCVSVDTYDYNMNGVPFWVSSHDVVQVSSDFDLTNRYVWEYEDRKSNMTSVQTFDDRVSPRQYDRADVYNRRFHVEAEGDSIRSVGMWCYGYFDHTDLSGWSLAAASAFFIENENTVAHSNCFLVSYSVEVEELFDMGNLQTGCCYATSEQVFSDHHSSCTISFTIPCPWELHGGLLSGTLSNTTVVDGHSPQSAGDSDSATINWEISGHPYFIYDFGDDFLYTQKDPYRQFHSMLGPVDLASICMSHGTSGVWGITIAGYYADGSCSLRQEFSGGVVHAPEWDIDLDKFVLKVSMAHYPRHRYTDVSEVKLGDLYKIDHPSVIDTYVRTLIFDRYLNDPIKKAQLPPPLGTKDPAAFDILELIPVGMEYVELFPVTIIDPPAP